MKPDELSNDHAVRELAGELGDLLSISTDLQFVADSARRYQQVLTEDDPGGILHRALWWSALVSYRRCFTSGRGHGLIRRTRLKVPDVIVDALKPALKEVHKVTLKAADQHVAHRVSDELSQMPISLLTETDASGDVTRVAGLAQLAALYLGPPAENAEELAVLADHLRDELEPLISTKQEAISSRTSEVLAASIK